MSASSWRNTAVWRPTLAPQARSGLTSSANTGVTTSRCAIIPARGRSGAAGVGAVLGDEQLIVTPTIAARIERRVGSMMGGCAGKLIGTRREGEQSRGQ